MLIWGWSVAAIGIGYRAVYSCLCLWPLQPFSEVWIHFGCLAPSPLKLLNPEIAHGFVGKRVSLKGILKYFRSLWPTWWGLSLESQNKTTGQTVLGFAVNLPCSSSTSRGQWFGCGQGWQHNCCCKLPRAASSCCLHLNWKQNDSRALAGRQESVPVHFSSIFVNLSRTVSDLPV